MNNDDYQQEKAIDAFEIDLKEIFNILWLNKALIISVTAFFAFGSVVYSLSLENRYRSESILTIAGQQNPVGSLSGLGGLASLTGINLPTSSDDKSVIAVKIVESRAFLKYLLTLENVLPSIMAVESYNSQSKTIEFDPRIYNKDNDTWLDKNKENKPPSYLETYETYLEQVSIEKDIATSLIYISYEHISPVFAKDFLEIIIKETNELLRQQDLKESADAIDFLLAEIPKSSLVTMKDAINQLVLSKLETQMMAKISSEYVFKMVEPPFIPNKKSGPSRALICIAGTFIGGILVCLWVLMRRYFLLK